MPENNKELRRLLCDSPGALDMDDCQLIAKRWARTDSQLAETQAKLREAQRRTRLLERENTDAFRLLAPCLSTLAAARKGARANDPHAKWLKRATTVLKKGRKLLQRSITRLEDDE